MLFILASRSRTLDSPISSNFLGILRYFASSGEQIFVVVDGMTVKNAREE